MILEKLSSDNDDSIIGTKPRDALFCTGNRAIIAERLEQMLYLSFLSNNVLNYHTFYDNNC